MKKTLAVIVLALAGSQAHAEGFYQLVVGDAPQKGVETAGPNPEFAHSPLYLQVIGGADRSGEIGTRAPGFTYSPLYLRVAANLVD